MKANRFDQIFDAGEKVTKQLDLTKAPRVGTVPKRVNVDRFVLGLTMPFVSPERVAKLAAISSRLCCCDFIVPVPSRMLLLGLVFKVSAPGIREHANLEKYA